MRTDLPPAPGGEFYHWAKVAAEIARLSPLAQMDIETLRAVVLDEERRED